MFRVWGLGFGVEVLGLGFRVEEEDRGEPKMQGALPLSRRGVGGWRKVDLPPRTWSRCLSFSALKRRLFCSTKTLARSFNSRYFGIFTVMPRAILLRLANPRAQRLGGNG